MIVNVTWSELTMRVAPLEGQSALHHVCSTGRKLPLATLLSFFFGNFRPERYVPLCWLWFGTLLLVVLHGPPVAKSSYRCYCGGAH